MREEQVDVPGPASGRGGLFSRSTPLSGENCGITWGQDWGVWRRERARIRRGPGGEGTGVSTRTDGRKENKTLCFSTTDGKYARSARDGSPRLGCPRRVSRGKLAGEESGCRWFTDDRGTTTARRNPYRRFVRRKSLPASRQRASCRI